MSRVFESMRSIMRLLGVEIDFIRYVLTSRFGQPATAKPLTREYNLQFTLPVVVVAAQATV